MCVRRLAGDTPGSAGQTGSTSQLAQPFSEDLGWYSGKLSAQRREAFKGWAGARALLVSSSTSPGTARTVTI